MDTPFDDNQNKEPYYRTNHFWLIVLAILILIIFFQHFPFRSKEKPAGIPVVTAKVQNLNVPIYLTEIGGVTPVYSVTVKTQINGRLLQVLFREGQMVKAGDLLAQIDPSPYEAQLIQYQGQLMRDQALWANAKIDLARYQKLWKENSVAQQTLATQVSLVAQYEGAIKIDQGLISATQINLGYCRITSPVDGRVGLRLVDPGNFVQTSDTTGIAVVATLSPITVIFSIPEDNVPDVLEQVNAGTPLEVKAFDRQQNKLLAIGTLLTMDNQIDPTTGTVKMRAQFKNDDNHLFPNQFVNAQLLVKVLKNALVVPTAAIQFGPSNSKFVYVVNQNSTVSAKQITTGPVSGELTVITKGLAANQMVVIEGTDKLTEGASVSIATANSMKQVNSTTRTKV